MGKPKAPKAPDPAKTASAQTATNIGTAVANTAGGQVNQYTPEGSLEYSQRGTYEYVDPLSGKTHVVPQYSATTSLTPMAQSIYDENQGAQLGMAKTANSQANFLNEYLGTPADFNTEAIEARINQLGSARLDPRFAREEEALRTRLANQGLSAGSDAWGAEMGAFNQSKNDAYNQLALTGRGQAFGEMGAMRNQPINEITALLSGSQVSPPNVGISQPDKAATVDYAGLVNQDYQNRLGLYNQKMAQRNSLLGGLFGMGSAAIMAA